MRVKGLLARLIGESTTGRLEYFLYPGLRDSWGGAFNGQLYRKHIFLDLLYAFPIKAIVETGTYRGATTALLAETSLPVWTIESQPRYFCYSQMRFRRNRDKIRLCKGDSCSCLLHLTRDSSVPKEDVFFYLDSHWEKDLPLREEVEIICSHWSRSIIMIDDFHVPSSDYGFSDYGQGKVLNRRYLDPVILRHHMSAFYPAVDSAQETGAKRGMVVLCREGPIAEAMQAIDTLRRDVSCRSVTSNSAGYGEEA